MLALFYFPPPLVYLLVSRGWVGCWVGNVQTPLRPDSREGWLHDWHDMYMLLYMHNFEAVVTPIGGTVCLLCSLRM